MVDAGSSGRMIKTGRVVNVSIFAHTKTAGIDVTIATIPDDKKSSFSPLYETWLSCNKYSASSAGADVRIDTNGNVLLTSVEAGYYKISGMWISVS